MKKLFCICLTIAIILNSSFSFGLEDKVIEIIEDCENNNLKQPFIKIEKICNNVLDGNFPVGELLKCDITFSNNVGKRILIKDNIGILLHSNIRVEKTEGIPDNYKIELPFQQKNGYFYIEKGSKWNQSFDFGRLNEAKMWRISIYLDCEGKNTLDYIEDRVEVVSKNTFNNLNMAKSALLLEKQNSERMFWIAIISLLVAALSIVATPLISYWISRNKIVKVEIAKLKDLIKISKTRAAKKISVK